MSQSSIPTMASALASIQSLPVDWHTHTAQAAFAAGAGVISHLGYFIRGEHHRSGPTIALFYLTLLPLLALAQYQFLHLGLASSVVNTVVLAISYAAGLFGSIAVYRGLFHPLRKFDGPFLARFSNLYHSWLLVEKSDNYRLMTKLHEEYGDIVRTGE
jgi:hypothetical protein